MKEHLFFPKQTALLMLCGLLPFLSHAQQRSKLESKQIAEKFANSNSFSRKFSDLKLHTLSSSISSNKELKNGREAYYIFSAPVNEDGFIIVSGDKRMPNVLAYSDENSFDSDNIPPNVLYWLDCYTKAYLSIDKLDVPPTGQTLTTNNKGVAPLLEGNKWNQGDPYNRLCPSVGQEKCLTGCVATAMAQVMKYHGYPSVGRGSISYNTERNNIHVSHDFSSDLFKWEYMIDDYTGKFTSEQANAVSELMSACGASVRMNYGTSAQEGSGALQEDLVPAFVEYFSYDQDAAFMERSRCSVEDWHRLLMKELDQGRPVNYGGISYIDRGGHSFVLDGYRSSEGNKFPDYHVNWGWGGKCNGYYQVANLHPVENEVEFYTKGAFSSGQQITLCIKPEDGIDSGIYYISSGNLNLSATKVKAGSTIQVYTASCVNSSYKDFTGTLHVALIPPDGSEELILGEKVVKTISYMQDTGNISFELTLPTDLPNGKYTIQLRSKQAKTDSYCQVFSASYPSVDVSENASDNPVIAHIAMLGSSELELSKIADSSIVCLKIYELQNLLNDPFVGDLRMILADRDGHQLAFLGDSIQPGELSMYEVMEEPLKIEGQLSGDWPDGKYKIYVGARLINTSDYVYVSFYDIAQPGISNQELCIDAEIKEGILIIDGKQYIITPANVRNISTAKRQPKDSTYKLDGRKDAGTGYGLNGIYISNGKKVLSNGVKVGSVLP